MATVAFLLVRLGLDSKRFNKSVKRVDHGLDNLINRFDRAGDIGKLTAITTAVGALTSLAAAAASAAGAVLALPATALMAGVGVAVLATGGSAEEPEEALSGLAPAAQSFVRSFSGVREWFEPVQQAVQQKLFAGLGEQLSACTPRMWGWTAA